MTFDAILKRNVIKLRYLFFYFHADFADSADFFRSFLLNQYNLRAIYFNIPQLNEIGFSLLRKPTAATKTTLHINMTVLSEKKKKKLGKHLHVAIVWKLSLILKHNFIAQLGEYLPNRLKPNLKKA